MTNVVFFLIFKADAKASVLRSKFQHQRVCNITFGGYIYIYINDNSYFSINKCFFF